MTKDGRAVKDTHPSTPSGSIADDKVMYQLGIAVDESNPAACTVPGTRCRPGMVIADGAVADYGIGFINLHAAHRRLDCRTRPARQRCRS